MLNVENVSKSFDRHRALDGVSLRAERGHIFGLLGPNGAGKSTLIRIINSIILPDSGHIQWCGAPLTLADTARIGYLPEERGLYRKMRVGEQAMYLARLKGLSAEQARRNLKQWFARFEMTDWWDRRVEELSKGMAQRVQFVATVAHNPELMIFDEPFSGFDPVNADRLKQEILRLRDEGATIIFSSHNMDSVERLCDHVALIDHGRVVLQGAVDDLRRAASTGDYRLTYSVAETGRHTEQLPPDQISRRIEALLTAGARIEALNEQMPSMNDIFIQTVKHDNQTTI